jgi:hypothetical protein
MKETSHVGLKSYHYWNAKHESYQASPSIVQKVSRSYSLTADTIAVTRCVLEKLVWQIAEVSTIRFCSAFTHGGVWPMTCF